MIQNNDSFKSLWFKRILLLASFLCLTGATAWSQTTLTVSGTQVPSAKVYDGTTLADAVPGTLVGVATDDTVYISAATAHYSSAVVGANKNVYVTYTLGGPQADLYEAKPDTLTANIVTRQLGITGTHIATKVYDRNLAATVDTVGELTNLVASDAGNVAVNISCVYLSYDADTLSPVAMSYSIHGTAASNYSAPHPDTLYGVVEPLTIYVSGVQTETAKVYDGTTAFAVTDSGAIDAGNVLTGDTVSYTVSADAASANNTEGYSVQLLLTFETAGPQGGNYVVSDTADLLWGSIAPLDLLIDYPTVASVKEYDGTNVAQVVDSATALNLVEGDTVVVVTTATYNDADTGLSKTITVHFDLQGPKALNYQAPADTLLSGAIILPTVFDTASGNAFNATLDGFCQGDSLKLAFDLLSGYPVGYYMLFSDEAVAQGFPDSVWMACAPTDSVIALPVPANCAGGTYQVTVTFVNLAGVHSNAYAATFVVNLSSSYLVQVFDDVISIDNSGALDNQPDRFQSFQWYHNGQRIQETKPYHQEMGGLTGTYQVIVNAGTADEGSVCPWDESKYVVTAPRQVVHVNPSPVVSQAQVKLQGEFENETHLLRLYNSFGTEVLSKTFSGRALTLDMSMLPQGTYLLSVDGVTAKTIKL